VVTTDEVAELASALPEVTVGVRRESRVWSVREKAFAWDRPFNKADIKRFGDAPIPAGPILAVRVADLHEKEAVLAAGRRGFFTIDHFDGYAAILIQLDKASRRSVGEALIDGWLSKAPAALVEGYLRNSRRG
jgi:hypothetical protein